MIPIEIDDDQLAVVPRGEWLALLERMTDALDGESCSEADAEQREILLVVSDDILGEGTTLDVGDVETLMDSGFLVGEDPVEYDGGRLLDLDLFESASAQTELARLAHAECVAEPEPPVTITRVDRGTAPAMLTIDPRLLSLVTRPWTRRETVSEEGDKRTVAETPEGLPAGAAIGLLAAVGVAVGVGAAVVKKRKKKTRTTTKEEGRK